MHQVQIYGKHGMSTSVIILVRTSGTIRRIRSPQTQSPNVWKTLDFSLGHNFGQDLGHNSQDSESFKPSANVWKTWDLSLGHNFGQNLGHNSVV